jgi:hypothetical protein
MEMLIADEKRLDQPLKPHLKKRKRFNLLWIKINNSMKKAIAIPLGMLKVPVDSSSGRDDEIRGVCSDGEDTRSSAIMRDSDGRSIAKSTAEYSLDSKL